MLFGPRGAFRQSLLALLCCAAAVLFVWRSWPALRGNIELARAMQKAFGTELLAADPTCPLAGETELVAAEVVDALRQAGQVRPGWLRPQVATALVQRGACDWAQARATLTPMLENGRTDLFAAWFAGEFALQMAEKGLLDREVAAADARRSWQAGGIAAGPLSSRAGSLYAERKYGAAAEWYRRALLLDPGSGEEWYKLGTALSQLPEGDGTESWERAVHAFRAELGERPAQRRQWYYLGRTYEALGEWRQALEAYSTALSVQQADPGASVLLYRMGSLYRERSDPPDEAAAEAAFAQALAANQYAGSDTSNLEAILHLNRGHALEALGDQTGALQEYRSAVRRDPGLYMGYVYLARAHLRLQEYEKAEEIARQATGLLPERKNAYHVLGSAYREQGKIDSAVAVYETILRLDPEDATAQAALQRLNEQ